MSGNMENNCINIFTTADDKYSQHLCVMIASVLDNLHSDIACCFYVFDFGITDNNKRKLEQLKKFHNFNIEYIKITDEYYSNLLIFSNVSYIPEHINISTYSRLLIPEIYKNLDKCLWLDVDLLVNEDISNLYEIDILDNAIGAVQEIWSESNNFKKRLKIKQESLYFICWSCNF